MRGSGFSYWPTPTASNNGNKVTIEISAERMRLGLPTGRRLPEGRQKSMKGSAISWTLWWLLLQAASWKPTRKPVRLTSCPSLLPVQVSLSPGTDAFASRLSCNPRFLTWLMGWPAEWTNPEAQVTGFARWLRRMRTALSRLPSAESIEEPSD